MDKRIGSSIRIPIRILDNQVVINPLTHGKYIYDNNILNDVVFEWKDEQIPANKLC